MQTVLLKFYVNEKQRHGGQLLYEWLLEQARALGVPGGSVFRAVAGYGRHGHLHEETFFELAGELPLEVEFVLEAALADRLLLQLGGYKLNLFYLRQPVEAGVI